MSWKQQCGLLAAVAGRLCNVDWGGAVTERLGFGLGAAFWGSGAETPSVVCCQLCPECKALVVDKVLLLLFSFIAVIVVSHPGLSLRVGCL